MISLCLFVCFWMEMACSREQNSRQAYGSQHPLIMHAKHAVAKTADPFEHIRLLHAGPSLFLVSLSRHFHLVRGHSLIRSITRSAITSAARCQRNHLISARLKALHGTSFPNVLLTLTNYGRRQSKV